MSSAYKAFSAYPTEAINIAGNNQGPYTLVYNGVLLNQGNGYDGTTGVFTCQIEGFYQFSAQLNFYAYLLPNVNFRLSILKNDAILQTSAVTVDGGTATVIANPVSVW